MAVETILDWNGVPVRAVRSRGGTWAFPDFSDGLIRTDSGAWPPQELVQKLHRSDKVTFFPPEDQPSLTARLGHYVDLQSANSEDAAVWSYFGPLVYAPVDVRSAWARSFLDLLGRSGPVEDCGVSLWRRVPHPDSLTSGGPEVDVCITTKQDLILIEAKWWASEGHWQGAEGLSTQMQLRSRFLTVLGPRVYAGKNLHLVYIMLDSSQILPDRSDAIKADCLLWSQILRETRHPLQQEVCNYFRWKWSLAPRASGRIVPDLFVNL